MSKQKVENVSEAPTKKAALVAYTDFEWMGEEYKIGDEFKPPANHVQDKQFEAFRAAEKLTKTVKGVAFLYPKKIGEERDSKTQKMVDITTDLRVILPVERKA